LLIWESKHWKHPNNRIVVKGFLTDLFILNSFLRHTLLNSFISFYLNVLKCCPRIARTGTYMNCGFTSFIKISLEALKIILWQQVTLALDCDFTEIEKIIPAVYNPDDWCYIRLKCN
jgi:hypothetical protein